MVENVNELIELPNKRSRKTSNGRVTRELN